MKGNPAYIKIEFLSDTTFSKGEETPGVVDIEIEHDELGLPSVGGKTIHGLLRDSWLSIAQNFPALHDSFRRIFGTGGDNNESSILRVGDARVDEKSQEWVNFALKRERDSLNAEMVLNSLTTIRTQTSQDDERGVPEDGSLRTVRVANRGLELFAPLSWLGQPDQEDLQCLAIAALATRQGGQSRNRGRGHIRMTLAPDYAYTAKIARGEK